MADVNAHVRELAEQLKDSGNGDELWGFICECGEPGCQERVPLSVAEYEQLRRGGDAVLAPGHIVGPVRVLVVDDNDACRQALAAVVSATEGFTLVGSEVSGEKALRVLPRLDPNLVLLDVRMPGLSGPETTRRIVASRPQAVVVLVSAYPDGLGTLAASCGAATILAKSDLLPERLTEVWAEARAQRLRAREQQERATEAKRVSGALLEEAQALNAQARHQLQRAERNLRSELPSG